MTPILPFYSPKLDLLCRSLDFTLFNGDINFHKDLNYFLPFLKNFCCCVAPYNDVSNVLQIFWNSTLFQCSLDQSMANSNEKLEKVLDFTATTGSICVLTTFFSY